MDGVDADARAHSMTTASARSSCARSAKSCGVRAVKHDRPPPTAPAVHPSKHLHGSRRPPHPQRPQQRERKPRGHVRERVRARRGRAPPWHAPPPRDGTNLPNHSACLTTSGCRLPRATRRRRGRAVLLSPRCGARV